MQTETQAIQRTLSRDDVLNYAELTDDFNPIHVDEEFAATTPFGGPIVHGTLTLTLVWDLLAALYPKRSLAGMKVSVRFTAPVMVGETVTAQLQESAADGGGLTVAVLREDGKPALTADVELP
ncbi:MAG: MaoC family dehydratase [Ectothiorhodospiraceae bacterium]|nr:MaoC family dehydratase [Ectothiorhodospiraceae bacterium]